MTEPSTIVVVVQSCHGEPELRTLEETAGEVRIEVVSTINADGLDCLDDVTIELGQPLGNRAVIDLTTGERVPEGG